MASSNHEDEEESSSCLSSESCFEYSLETSTAAIPENLTRLCFVDASNSVREIPAEALRDCRSLIDVEFPHSLKRIGMRAFKGCSGIKRISIPASVELISDGAFQGVTSLIQLDLSETNLKRMKPQAFAECYKLCKVALPITLKRIERESFQMCSQLVSLQVSHTLQVIEERSFEGCELLQNISLSSDLEAIHPSAFDGCESLLESSSGVKDIVDVLKGRFDALPIHQACYSLPFHHQLNDDSDETNLLLKLVFKDTTTNFAALPQPSSCDGFGMTALHVVVMSTRPTSYLCRLLIEHGPQDLMAKNVWGDAPLYAACVCRAPLEIIQLLVQAQLDHFPNQQPDWISLVQESDSIDTIHFLVSMSIANRIKQLGSKHWKLSLQHKIEQIGTPPIANSMIHYNRNELTGKTRIMQQLCHLHYSLERFIRKEVLSLLELAIWRARLALTMMEPNNHKSSDIRKACRVQCGATVIIPLILPYLDTVDLVSSNQLSQTGWPVF